MKLCSVHQCHNVGGVPRHRFPNPKKYPDRFQEWLKRVNNLQLFQIDPIKVYNEHTVCRLHFRPSDCGPNNILQNTALPCLRIPNGKSKNNLFKLAFNCHKVFRISKY
jgi:hypothetical protein